MKCRPSKNGRLQQILYPSTSEDKGKGKVVDEDDDIEIENEIDDGGVGAEARDPNNPHDPLIMASLYGHIDIVNLLINECGDDI